MSMRWFRSYNYLALARFQSALFQDFATDREEVAKILPTSPSCTHESECNGPAWDAILKIL